MKVNKITPPANPLEKAEMLFQHGSKITIKDGVYNWAKYIFELWGELTKKE